VLEGDLRPSLEWAEKVFGGPPEATNLWIGDERSVTSFHKGERVSGFMRSSWRNRRSLVLPIGGGRRCIRSAHAFSNGSPCADHYENLYAVITGTKIFTLLPPSDVWRMGLRKHPAARWAPERQEGEEGCGVRCASCGGRKTEVHGAGGLLEGRMEEQRGREGGAEAGRGGVGGREGEEGGGGQVGSGRPRRLKAELKQPAEEVAWCAINPRSRDAAERARFPHFFDPDLPGPLVAEVGPGEVLYLPSIWFHHVEQRPESGRDYATAVNFW
jgi:jumonji domain-containing protein 7